MGKKLKNKKESNSFFKYTSLALQLGLTIAVFAFLGRYLDQKYETETPWFTLCGSLLGVGSGLYLALRDLVKINK